MTKDMKNTTPINIYFASFWPGFDPYNNFFLDVLSEKFNLVVTPNSPDLIIHSIFDKEYLKYNCIRVGYTGENTRPDFKRSDYYIGFDYIDNERYLRWPLYLIATPPHQLLNKNAEEIINQKRKFAAFVVSNPKAEERIEFFKKLSKYKQVSSGGKVLNNIGYRVKDINQFLLQHKFTIAFENSSYPGYTTEKLTQAMRVGSIPIYWGNTRIAEEFNTKSFINIHDFESLDDVINYIIEIDNDEKKYLDMLHEPWFKDNFLQKSQVYETFYCFFERVIKQNERINKVLKYKLIIFEYLPYTIKQMIKKIGPHLKFRIRQLKRFYQKLFIIQDYVVKRKIILVYAKKYQSEIFVETGTFLGDTVETMKTHFLELFSIELADKLATSATERFKNEKHINIISGDSSKILPSLCKQLNKPTLFWLDGHYSSNFYIGETYIETAKGLKETPIMEELRTILEHGIRNNVILIDDARCFNGTSDYPTIKELKKTLLAYGITPNQIKIKKDIIRIIPNQKVFDV